MVEGYFVHEDGVLFKEGLPRALTYDLEADVELIYTPKQTYEGNLKIEYSNSSQMELYLTPEESRHFLEKASEPWKEDNPLYIKFSVNTAPEAVEQVPLKGPDILLEETEEIFGADFRNQSPEEIVETMKQEFEFERGETFDRDDFLDERKGQCDQFSELMSLGRENWIKQNGYARQGDRNLPNQELRFSNHAWVLDTEESKVYDPTPLISRKLDPERVEMNDEVYFLRMPLPSVEIGGEVVSRKVFYSEKKVSENYTVESNVEKSEI